MDRSLLSGQLRAIFIEETDDGLETMERGLLHLDAGGADDELVNGVFRAAHSIKGGAGTFGLAPMVELTHHAESILDELRAGKRSWSVEIGSALLSAVDELRGMLDAVRHGRDELPTATPALVAHLEALASAGTTDVSASDSDAVVSTPRPPGGAPAAREVTVHFTPRADLMATGNDPLLLLRELGGLGESKTTCHLEHLPALEMLEPHDCYLRWTVTLTTAATRDDIMEVFAWVEDECELEIVEAPAAAERADATSAVDAESSDVSEAHNPTEGRSSGDRAPTESNTRGRPAEQGSIRVGIEKVDALVDMVGELVITQSMLSQLSREPDPAQLEALRVGIQQLERNTRELQEGVMRMRMLPIGFVFARLPRLVRDLGRQLGKDVELITTGETTELDKTVLEKISDPLVHLVRNSVDHGIEPADLRTSRNKPTRGTVEIAASHQGGSVVIAIRDDGGGIDVDRLRAKAVDRGIVSAADELDRAALRDLIFHPGLSTAAAISDISGRGVGMDVVRRNIHELGGTIELDSTLHQGTQLTIRLPLTLAILDGQLFRLGDQTYVLPLISVVESLVPSARRLSNIAGGAEVYRLRDAFIPLLRLSDLYGLPGDGRRFEDSLMIVTEGSQGPVGLMVDELLGQQQVVIKSLERNFDRVDGVAGATILGNGHVALIADVPGLLRLHASRPTPCRSSGQDCAA